MCFLQRRTAHKTVSPRLVGSVPYCLLDSVQADVAVHWVSAVPGNIGQIEVNGGPDSPILTPRLVMQTRQSKLTVTVAVHTPVICPPISNRLPRFLRSHLEGQIGRKHARPDQPKNNIACDDNEGQLCAFGESTEAVSHLQPPPTFS